MPTALQLSNGNAEIVENFPMKMMILIVNWPIILQFEVYLDRPWQPGDGVASAAVSETADAVPTR